ncbi:MAG: NAD(P)/FAD-dependent oxidoreductase, partial [Gammaproteobacteria bacterium]|nr:NAD(P)/FAD-dependent oxidoreductase [Gammaproteobacteria bacterium]
MKKSIAIIGGGPAGLMAAEILSQNDVTVDLYESMPSLGRKFLMAGKSGLNLTHAEPYHTFITRYGDKQKQIETHLNHFKPDDLLAWVKGLGIETFIGSSGRIFPKEMKASPLLRAWLQRLQTNGVTFHTRHHFKGWQEKSLVFDSPAGSVKIKPDATILALGGASWPKLGSRGEWVL